MGINLTEISQKVLDTVGNAANVFRKMYDLHYNPTPMDVPMEYVDENGVKRTTNIPNVAGFRKRVWDDVGAALGQFTRTFYVDQVNGDDNNDGSSSYPFRTLKKAIDSVPVGGYGKIYVSSNIDIDKDIHILNKYIEIEAVGWDWNVGERTKTIFLKGRDEVINGTYGIRAFGSTIIIRFFNIDTGNLQDTTQNRYWKNGLFSSDANTNTSVNFYLCKVFMNGNNLVTLAPGIGGGMSLNLFGTDIVKNNSSGYLIDAIGGQIYSLFYTGLITDGDGNTIDLIELLTGIVRDSNGVIKNVISNQVL